MQISAANLIAAQQAPRAGLAAKQAARTAQAAPAFALPDLQAAGPAKAADPTKTAAPVTAAAPQAQARARLGPHINIVVERASWRPHRHGRLRGDDKNLGHPGLGAWLGLFVSIGTE